MIHIMTYVSLTHFEGKAMYGSESALPASAAPSTPLEFCSYGKQSFLRKHYAGWCFDSTNCLPNQITSPFSKQMLVHCSHFLFYSPNSNCKTASNYARKMAKIMTLGALTGHFRSEINIQWKTNNRLIHRALCEQPRMHAALVRGSARYQFYASQVMRKRTRWENQL